MTFKLIIFKNIRSLVDSSQPLISIVFYPLILLFLKISYNLSFVEEINDKNKDL